ncbi:hypothetical protein R3P38DRAFT_3164676 [Favolaschia claudopus]|uniref:Uncharacterized protein n=1 Tax=Favolaschia claudopus TaxID=2862362 RepID=A0AAW0EFU8_9AGAR
MKAVGLGSGEDLRVQPRDALSSGLPFTPSSTYVQTISLSTSLSPSFVTSDGQTQTTLVPVTTLVFESLVPYIPSQSAQDAVFPSQSAIYNTHKSSIPIIPIVAVAGGGLTAIIAGVALCLIFHRRRRKASLRWRTVIQAHGPPDLDLELPRDENRVDSRTFSRLTYSAPYVVPQSSVGLASIAAPSTVSIGQQYQTVRVPRR